MIKKTVIKLDIKTNDIEDPLLSESLFMAWHWIRKNAPKFKLIKFELGEWEMDWNRFCTKLIVEVVCDEEKD